MSVSRGNKSFAGVKQCRNRSEQSLKIARSRVLTKMTRGRIKSWPLVVFALAILPAMAGATFGIYLSRIESRGENGIKRFSSYEELRQFLSSKQGDVWPWPAGLSGFPGLPNAALDVKFASGMGAQTRESVEYSTTNVQVEGVDESDIIKTDGEYLYIISGRRLLLIRAYPPEDMEISSEVELVGDPVGLYVSGKRLIVLEQIYQMGLLSEGENRILPAMNVSVKIYDTSDRDNPSLLREYLVSGFYSESRMLEPYVYVVVVEPAVVWKGEVILPRICAQGSSKEIAATEIYYYNESSERAHSFVTVFAINFQEDDVPTAYKTFLTGASDTIYMSRENMYIAQRIWRTTVSNGFVGIVPLRAGSSYEKTAIYKLHIDGLSIEHVARGEARGFLLNQFSMDEHKGFLRIATTSHGDYDVDSVLKEANNIYVFDSEMNLVGALEDLAPGEMIHSARFTGDICYLVTFKKVDPLFVIDLSSPSEPRILGKLKVPGYSDYLHPLGDGFLIGVGKETVEAEEGNFAWYQGLKISLFDVRQLDNPKEVSKLVIGDRGTDSPALYDHKALLLDTRRKLLVLPVLVAEVDPSDYPEGVPPNVHGEFVWQGIYVLDITAEGGIWVRGRITHLEGAEDLSKSGSYFYSKYSVKRALYVDDVLYTISDGKIKANDISTLKELGTLRL